MKKKTRNCILLLVILGAVVYYFDINPRELFSTIRTVCVDNLSSLFPDIRGQFENINTQINSEIVKNSTAHEIILKTQEAKKIASSRLKGTWLKTKKLTLKYGINLDNVFFLFKNRFKYIKRGKTEHNESPYYLFDFQNMSIEEISSLRQSFIDYSLSLRGIPYVLGSDIPERGLDCSSFVQYSARNGCNIVLPRTARQQYISAEKITFSDIEPGDLLFFRAYGRIDHVGIYLGVYDGEGILKGRKIFINAASEGPRTGVVISALDEPYWKKHFNSCGRIIPSSKEIVEASILKE